MKSRLNFSGASLSIKTPIRSFLLSEFFGIVLFITGLYNPGSTSFLDHLLIGAGIILISLGLFYISNSRYYKMVVNEGTGELSIFESNSWDISPFKIPSDYFSGILIQLIVNKKNKIEYDVLLKNRPGSFIMLARFPDRKRAILFGEKLNQMLQKIIDEQTDPWGVKVSTVEIKEVELAEEMKRSMAAQAEAERERRAKIIHAEGELQASEKLSQAAAIIGREPATIQLRYLSTLSEIASENNSTIVFPLPIDLFKAFMGKSESGNK